MVQGGCLYTLSKHARAGNLLMQTSSWPAIAPSSRRTDLCLVDTVPPMTREVRALATEDQWSYSKLNHFAADARSVTSKRATMEEICSHPSWIFP
jgi:hypothetical protein